MEIYTNNAKTKEGISMSIQGIPNVTSSTALTKTSTEKKQVKEAEKDAKQGRTSDVAAVYEPSKDAKDSTPKIYKQDTATIATMKADAEKRTQELRNLVKKLLLEQGQKFNESEDMYKLLREGKLDVDPETAAQAAKDVSEDGYYGVKQTSERLFSFAYALAGGDPSKAQMLKDAFIQGYKEAEKAWGGELPEISKQTYDATIKKFDEWMGGGAPATEA